MKKRETEVTEEAEETTGAAVLAPIVATAAAIFAFWWLGKYSLLNERDIVGTTITVWCAVVIRIRKCKAAAVQHGGRILPHQP